MKSKLIYANYFPETGESEVVIENKRGMFVGQAQCHPEEEAPSDYAGCRYAEARAHIAATQYEKKILNYKIEELENFEKILKSLKDYNPHCLEARRLRRRIHELKSTRKQLIENMQAMKAAITRAMDERDAWLEKHKTK